MARRGIDILYLVVAAALLYSTLDDSNDWLHYASKALLMPVLALTLFPLNSSARKLALVAVIFSWIGDLALMLSDDLIPDFDPDLWFMVGLGAFLVAHCAYIWSFTKVNKSVHQVPVIKKYPLLMFAYVGIAAWIFIKLAPNLGEMAVPVFLYAFAILILLITGTNRYGRVSQVSFLLVMIGTWLFTLSDSLIAFNKFDKPIEMASFWILLTYAGAQWMIIKGIQNSE